jgi:hypothetical protein
MLKTSEVIIECLESISEDFHDGNSKYIVFAFDNDDLNGIWTHISSLIKAYEHSEFTYIPMIWRKRIK